MTVNTKLAICVINGYPAANRQVLADAGMKQAHELYVDFLEGIRSARRRSIRSTSPISIRHCRRARTCPRTTHISGPART